MHGVLKSVAVAASAVCALLGPAMPPAGSAAVPHPVRAATDARGGGDGSLITRLHTPPTGTSIASPARNTLYACQGGPSPGPTARGSTHTA